MFFCFQAFSQFEVDFYALQDAQSGLQDAWSGHQDTQSGLLDAMLCAGEQICVPGEQFCAPGKYKNQCNSIGKIMFFLLSSPLVPF